MSPFGAKKRKKMKRKLRKELKERLRKYLTSTERKIRYASLSLKKNTSI